MHRIAWINLIDGSRGHGEWVPVARETAEWYAGLLDLEFHPLLAHRVESAWGDGDMAVGTSIRTLTEAKIG